MNSSVVFHRKLLKPGGCTAGSFGNVPWVSSQGCLLLLLSYFLQTVTYVECCLGRVSLAQYFHLPKRNSAEWLMGNPTATSPGITILYVISNFLSFHTGECEGCLLTWGPPATIAFSSVPSTKRFHWEPPLSEMLSRRFQ